MFNGLTIAYYVLMDFYNGIKSDLNRIQCALRWFRYFTFLLLLTSCAVDGSFDVYKDDRVPEIDNLLPTDGSVIDDSDNDTYESVPSNPSYKIEALAWESISSPERVLWTMELIHLVRENFFELNQAPDIDSFCPNYNDLNEDQRMNVWANIFASMAYYESGWNPSSASVDVGSKKNKDTWSVGLLQVSVVDQVNYKLNYEFSFKDLQDPIKNLKLAVSIMAFQIKKRKKILIPQGESGTYWAVIHPGGKYDKTYHITKMTKKMTFCQQSNK
ncbi:MAG TPA: transglycosylase SLT domain-containing protein [Pseudobdellovibrionaceae bacterium]|nr:transglycosylase SLT domain-containing protein [Pseudobdellovibrionaceae bacterium]